MDKILNLTQHNATNEQIAQGVIDLSADKKVELSALLTFEELPDVDTLINRALKIAVIAIEAEAESVLIGGAPFFLNTLAATLMQHNIKSYHAFTKRESVEVEKDGKIIKTSVFKHVGFIPHS
jgi:hypothetical protein